VSAPIIDPHTIFTLDSLSKALSLKAGTLPREMRLKRLRYAKRAGRIFILGHWVIQWLEAGEVIRRRPHAAKINGKA
jgi:hypothetical protein